MQTQAQLRQFSSTDRSSKAIKAVLEQLKTQLTENIGEVESSIHLLDLGSKTSLASRIENGFLHALDIPDGDSQDLDHDTLRILDQVWRGFFKARASLITEAYRLPNSDLVLDYYIVLKENTEDSQDVFWDFLYSILQADLSTIYKSSVSFLLEEEVAMMPEGLVKLGVHHA